MDRTTIEDLNFSFQIHQAQLWSLIRNDFILFYSETYKIRRTTCLITIIFVACYLLKLGLNVEAEIQILNCIYPLLPCLKTAKKTHFLAETDHVTTRCLGFLKSFLAFAHPDIGHKSLPTLLCD